MSASDLYSQDLRGVPTLPPEEQHALACRYARTRDPRDARRLVLANLRLVVSLANKLAGRRRSDLMDLVQEGNAGLMVAVERFDPTRGLKLSAYAAIWIRAFILRHLMETGHVVRATTTRDGRRQFFEHTLPGDVSLDDLVVRGDEDLRPDVAAESRDELQRVRAAVTRLEETLSARERVILQSRLLCERPKPLRQLGTKLALSGERVRQLEREMLERLRTLVEDTPSPDLRTAA